MKAAAARGFCPSAPPGQERGQLFALSVMGNPAFVLCVLQELPEPPELRGLVLPEPPRLIAPEPAVHPAGIKAVCAIQNALQHFGGMPASSSVHTGAEGALFR